jgi:hypothetical protein
MRNFLLLFGQRCCELRTAEAGHGHRKAARVLNWFWGFGLAVQNGLEGC